MFEAFQNIYKNVKTIKLVLAGYKKNDKSQIPYALIRKFKKHEAISVVNFSDKNIKLIKNCSCVILPSYREGMPRSLLEAGLLKKISIAANVPGCRDIIKNGYNGYLFQKGNVSDLEKKNNESL